MKKLLLSIFTLGALAASAQSWTASATGYTEPTYMATSIAVPSATVAWTKASDITITAPTADVTKVWSKTTDGGLTWTSGAISGSFVNAGTSIGCITAVSADKAWVSAFQGSNNNLGGIYATTDGGANWARQTSASFNTTNSASASFPNIVYFWNENNGFCQGDPAAPLGTTPYFEIYTTSNGGTNWTRVSSANIPLPLNGDEFGYTNNLTVVGNTVWFGTSQGRLFRSSDMGATWQAFQTPATDFGSATTGGNYAFADANNGIFISSALALYRTTNGGQTWTPATYTGPVFATDLQWIPGTTSYVSTGLNTPTGTSISTDSGATWTLIDSAPHGTTAFFDASTGYSAGLNPAGTAIVIFKFVANLRVDEVGVNKIALVPNPTNGPLQLSGVTVNQVELFDLTGKKVLSQSFDAVQDATIDVSALQSGAYILQATTDSGLKESVRFLKK